MDRIIIFGAGNTGKRAYEQNHEKYDIQCFLDNDQKKWGKPLYNIPINQPTKENIEKYSFDYIMIASVFGIKEIEAKELYLFDTFSGFPESDIEMEKKKLLSEVKTSYYSETSVEQGLDRMPYPQNVRIYKGYFPDTAIGIKEKFCFVRIDVDLYSPTVAALEFFHSLMVHGGCIVVHDYFGESYKGIRRAVAEYLENHLELSKIPIGDMLSIAIVGY